MSQLTRFFSMLGFACLLALGFAGTANAAEGGVSKAVYATPDKPVFQLIGQKPCCFYPNSGYTRVTPSTCRRNGGYTVQDGYCGGYGYPGYPGHPGYQGNPNWGGGHPGWGGGHPNWNQRVCCKRKRRDWWSPNAYTCQQQGGYVVHRNFCYND